MKLDGQASKTAGTTAGYAMAALLVSLAIMAILMSVAMPTWRQAAQREREDELIFRGKQYARAVELFQRRYANAFPPNVDVLIQQSFLRKKYKDPMTEDGEFQLLYQLDMQQPGGRQAGGRGGATGTGGSAGRGAQPSALGGPVELAGMGGVVGPRGGIVGVVSTSKEKSIRLYNGRNYYNEWQFVYVPLTVGPGGGPGGVQQRPGRGEEGGRGLGFPGGMGGGRGAGGRGPEGGGRGMGPGGPERGRGGMGPGGAGRMGPGRGSIRP